MWGCSHFNIGDNPLWCFNGEDDATRCGRKGPDNAAALAKILFRLFNREEQEFVRIKPRGGFSMYNPPSWVSCTLFTLNLPALFILGTYLAIS